MTEPDFEQIALRLTAALAVLPIPYETAHALATEARECFRQVWNARGAADIAQLDKAKVAAPPFPQADPYVKLVERAIRKLDR